MVKFAHGRESWTQRSLHQSERRWKIPLGFEQPEVLADKFAQALGIAHPRDGGDDPIPAGERLLVVGRRGATFTVIRHPNPSPKTSAPTS